jgi:hypothetical protein
MAVLFYSPEWYCAGPVLLPLLVVHVAIQGGRVTHGHQNYGRGPKVNERNEVQHLDRRVQVHERSGLERTLVSFYPSLFFLSQPTERQI